jgi:hypothetical protein
MRGASDSSYPRQTLQRVSTGMSLHVLTCNLKRVIMILDTSVLMKANLA